MKLRDGFAPQPERIHGCERCIYGDKAKGGHTCGKLLPDIKPEQSAGEYFETVAALFECPVVADDSTPLGVNSFRGAACRRCNGSGYIQIGVASVQPCPDCTLVCGI